MKDPHNSWVPSIQHSRNPAGSTPIPPRRRFIHQHFITLHRSVQLIWRDKEIIASIHTPIRPNEPISVPMQIQSTSK
jgi:hypothetical protein